MKMVFFISGGKTPSAATAGKSGQATKTALPKKPVWTKQDDMARKIQSCYRSYRYSSVSTSLHNVHVILLDVVRCCQH